MAENLLNSIRLLTGNELQEQLDSTVPSNMLPLGYISQLSAPERTTVNCAILLAWTVTNGTQAPREMQLRATLATYYGQDSVVNAGTESGKTLPIALNILLDDPQAQGITLTISPLKRLQITQVQSSSICILRSPDSFQETDFKSRYGIPTIAVNKDTPREDKYWHENIYSPATKRPGINRHIIATVKQLFKSPEGHLPRLAILLGPNSTNSE
ncbi:hypothetical protein DXG03_005649 [Asterophora parasitica]|uniref:Uncharacterized protein n=1 Tax=Asterophora parasitica TaxID=117018 RepID=A0A9P7G1Q9_9AGAR|nr:hypothetical protein DXG03_005649 [Asterophora parasitica]